MHSASLVARGGSPFQRLWQGYERQLQRRPVMVQMATAAILWGAGDVLAQRVVERKARLDVRRTALTAAFGGAILGPFGHWWYTYLDVVCARFGAPGSARFLLSKLLIDNAVFNPLNITAFFAFGSAAIDQEGPAEFVQKMRSEFVSTFAVEAVIWPPYMALIFARVPLHHQMLAVNFGTLFDVCFLSWVRNQEGGLDAFVAAAAQRFAAAVAPRRDAAPLPAAATMVATAAPLPAPRLSKRAVVHCVLATGRGGAGVLRGCGLGRRRGQRRGASGGDVSASASESCELEMEGCGAPGCVRLPSNSLRTLAA